MELRLERKVIHTYVLMYQAVTQMSGEALSFPPNVAQDQKATR